LQKEGAALVEWMLVLARDLVIGAGRSAALKNPGHNHTSMCLIQDT
jgi:hypothetical protein